MPRIWHRVRAASGVVMVLLVACDGSEPDARADAAADANLDASGDASDVSGYDAGADGDGVEDAGPSALEVVVEAIDAFVVAFDELAVATCACEHGGTDGEGYDACVTEQSFDPERAACARAVVAENAEPFVSNMVCETAAQQVLTDCVVAASCDADATDACWQAFAASACPQVDPALDEALHACG